MLCEHDASRCMAAVFCPFVAHAGESLRAKLASWKAPRMPEDAGQLEDVAADQPQRGERVAKVVDLDDWHVAEHGKEVMRVEHS